MVRGSVGEGLIDRKENEKQKIEDEGRKSDRVRRVES